MVKKVKITIEPKAIDPPQAEEYIVGRFYEVIREGETLYGEFVEWENEEAVGLRTLEVWVNGKPSHELDLFFENHRTCEINRELCYERSSMIE